MNFRKAREGGEPEINLIPLIDVVLVIIIFLTLTTTFSKISGLEVNLPTAEGQESATLPDEINIAVMAGGEVLVNRLPVNGSGVDPIVAALGRVVTGDANQILIINADANAAHQRVIDVMQAAQRVGLAHVTFATQSPEGGEGDEDDI